MHPISSVWNKYISSLEINIFAWISSFIWVSEIFDNFFLNLFRIITLVKFSKNYWNFLMIIFNNKRLHSFLIFFHHIFKSWIKWKKKEDCIDWLMCESSLQQHCMFKTIRKRPCTWSVYYIEIRKVSLTYSSFKDILCHTQFAFSRR